MASRRNLGVHTLKIYAFPRTRATRAIWAAEEVEAEYDLVNVDLAQGESRRTRFLGINPGGKVPVLEDDGLVISESAAIVTYLGDKYPGSGLVPAPATPERAQYNRWCFFVVGELEQPLWTLAKHKFAIPEKWRVPEIRNTARWEFSVAAQILAQGLGQSQFILGEHFSGADILVAHTLRWARNFEVPVGDQELEDYADRMLARPAFRRAMKREAAA